MPTQNRNDATTNPSKRQIPPSSDDEATGEDRRDLSTQRRQSQSQSQSSDGDSSNDDRVEIGDPVPEHDRTIKANDETGEDEDFPDDDFDGNTEASMSERH